MPQGGTRTPLALSYSWGQQGWEAQFAGVFQPAQRVPGQRVPACLARPDLRIPAMTTHALARVETPQPLRCLEISPA